MVSPRIFPLTRALCLLLGLFVVLGGCSDDGGEQDPARLLEQAATAMKGAESFHVVYDVRRPQNAEPLPGLDIVGITGDVAGEGEMRATIDVLQNGVPLQLEFVATGPLHYLRNPATDQWQSVPAVASPVGQLNLNAGTIEILERVSNTTYEGREDVDGVATHHLKGTVQGEDIAQIVAALNAQGAFSGEVWIGVDDHLVRRIQIDGTVAKGEDAVTVRTVTLSKFNEPVTIEPPITRGDSPPTSKTSPPSTTPPTSTTSKPTN